MIETTVHKLVSGNRPLPFELGSNDERLEMRIVVSGDLHDGIFESGLD